MKHVFLFLSILFTATSLSFAQETEIVKEEFGTSTQDIDPADYQGYTSSALFDGDDSHLFQTAGSSGYEHASGDVAIAMGNWGTAENTEFVMQVNTDGYPNVYLSFGIKHNSGGWGTCALTNNFTKIEYSTDSAFWTEVDKNSLKPGSSWPCAEDDVWAWIEIAESLPVHATLNIRFTHTDPDKHPYFLDDIRLTYINLSDNADLSDLSVDVGTLSPDFDAATTEYTVTVPSGTSETPTVTPTLADENASYAIDDATDIQSETEADRTTTITVTAEDEETEKVYTVVFDGVVGMKEIENQNITLYPNPVANVMHIELKNQMHINQVKINDITGKNVFTKTLNVNKHKIELPLPDLDKGVYMLQVFDGKSVYTTSFVKQ